MDPPQYGSYDSDSSSTSYAENDSRDEDLHDAPGSAKWDRLQGIVTLAKVALATSDSEMAAVQGELIHLQQQIKDNRRKDLAHIKEVEKELQETKRQLAALQTSPPSTPAPSHSASASSPRTTDSTPGTPAAIAAATIEHYDADETEELKKEVELLNEELAVAHESLAHAKQEARRLRAEAAAPRPDTAEVIALRAANDKLRRQFMALKSDFERRRGVLLEELRECRQECQELRAAAQQRKATTAQGIASLRSKLQQSMENYKKRTGHALHTEEPTPPPPQSKGLGLSSPSSATPLSTSPQGTPTPSTSPQNHPIPPVASTNGGTAQSAKPPPPAQQSPQSVRDMWKLRDENARLKARMLALSRKGKASPSAGARK